MWSVPAWGRGMIWSTSRMRKGNSLRQAVAPTFLLAEQVNRRRVEAAQDVQIIPGQMVRSEKLGVVMDGF